jgi:predicted transcriptional regulator
MKAVMISIRPEWCEKIASGEKTVEVRKTRPKIEPPFKCYIYCTKGKGDCLWKWNGIWYDTQDPKHRPNRLDGMVIGEFVCDGIIEATFGQYVLLPTNDTQMDPLDLMDYAEGKTVYGWNISELVIYDQPKKLSEFRAHNVRTYTDEKGYPMPTHEMTRPPQSWCYVEEVTT